MPSEYEINELAKEESWRMFRIMGELVEGFDTLTGIEPAVTIYGASQLKSDDRLYVQTEEIAKRLGKLGFSIITGGGPGVMEAANKGASAAGVKSVGVNIELPEEIVSVIDHGGDGIGLYRTEFQYMNRPDFPSEDELFDKYKDVVEVINPKPVTIRTLDINGDKALMNGTDLDEENIGQQKFGIMIDSPEQAEANLNWCDIALVTGTTLVNDTIKAFKSEKPTIFFGVTITNPTHLLSLTHFCPYNM